MSPLKTQPANYKLHEGAFTSTIRHWSPRFWGHTTASVLSRFEVGQAELLEMRKLHPSQWEGVEVFHKQSADVHFLLVCIRNVLELADEQIQVTEDSSLAKAKEDFERAHPDARDLRDILEHLRHYQAGKGRLQLKGTVSSVSDEPFLRYQSPIDPSSEVELFFGLGDRKLRLKTAARAAVQLAQMMMSIQAKTRGDEAEILSETGPPPSAS